MPKNRLNLLNNVDRTKVYPNVFARAAATLLIYDIRDGIKLYMGRRHIQSGLAAGRYAFPGGAVETEDETSLTQPIDDQIAHLIHQGDGLVSSQQSTGAKAQTLTNCVFRECLEETGMTITASSDATFSPPSRLLYIGRAITPFGRKTRFDTHFFAIDATHMNKRRNPSSEELVACAWVPLEETLNLAIHPMTHVFIEEFKEHLDHILNQTQPPKVRLYYMTGGKFTSKVLFSAKTS